MILPVASFPINRDRLYLLAMTVKTETFLAFVKGKINKIELNLPPAFPDQQQSNNNHDYPE
jgi:hypothetical protein